MLITASPEISGVSSRYIGSWSVTGAGCCAAAAGPAAASPGTPSTKSKNGHRYCHLNCASPTGSCRRLQCCEPTAEERWCGKSARHVLWEPGAGDRLRRPGGRGEILVPTATLALKSTRDFRRSAPLVGYAEMPQLRNRRRRAFWLVTTCASRNRSRSVRRRNTIAGLAARVCQFPDAAAREVRRSASRRD